MIVSKPSGHDGAVDKLRQVRQRELSLHNGDGPWTIVSDDWHHSDGDNGGRFAAFSQPSHRSQVLSRGEWDLKPGEGGPGFMQHNEDGKWVTTYFRNSEGPEVEPLVLVQSFYGVVPDTYLIADDFRLLMNLWQDPATGNYFSIGDDGSKDLAVEFKDGQIRVRTPLLRRYQAARQLDLLLFTDSAAFVHTDEPVEAFEHLSEPDHVEDGLNFVEFNVGEVHIIDRQICSRLLVKRILPPPPQEQSGIWPWDELDEEYPEFIIGEDKNGRPVRFTCEEDKLANYFGKNPDAPHYLTPVFFKPDVLQRYYDNPAIYSISDGRLSCGNLWGVQIDNGNPDVVMVFLGDIGRDIPSSHRTHWLAHNIAPVGPMSASTFRRSFLNQFAETENPEHLFKQAYEAFQDGWEEAWGWRLHRKPSGTDKQVIQRLHIPLNESDAELEAQLLGLAKLLVDFLNEADIARDLPKVANEKGISKLERFLRAAGYAEVDRDVELLRRIQNLRSRIAAHTGGQTFLASELKGESKRKFIVDLMEQATRMLAELVQLRPDEEAVEPLH